MKRFLTMIATACALFAVSAQNPMVTLSHDGELSFFSTPLALQAAIDSAQKGDIIYLSEGEFVMDTSTLTLYKRLSIVGSGYGSHIIGKIFVNMSEDYDSILCAAPLFDGVRLDQLEFYGDAGNANGYKSYNNLQSSVIRNCRIHNLIKGGWAGNNIIFDKCILDCARFEGPGAVTVKNSKLSGTLPYAGDCLHNIVAINCNIVNHHMYPRTMISCIFQERAGYSTQTSGTHSIINSVLDRNVNTNVSLSNCYMYDSDTLPLLDENLDCPLNLEELGYLGQDGTVVGIMGGESPFSENPSVPTVASEKSSVEYDAENNKLKVTITVAEN